MEVRGKMLASYAQTLNIESPVLQKKGRGGRRWETQTQHGCWMSQSGKKAGYPASSSFITGGQWKAASLSPAPDRPVAPPLVTYGNDPGISHLVFGHHNPYQVAMPGSLVSSQMGHPTFKIAPAVSSKVAGKELCTGGGRLPVWPAPTTTSLYCHHTGSSDGGVQEGGAGSTFCTQQNLLQRSAAAPSRKTFLTLT